MKKYKYWRELLIIMNNIQILKELFDDKILKVLKLFIDNKSKKYYLREISRLTGISPATTYRILNKLVDKNFLKIEKIKKTKLYKFSNNEKTELLASILKKEKSVIQIFVEKVKKFESIDNIIFH